MSGPAAVAGLSPFEASASLRHLRVTVVGWCSRQHWHFISDRRHTFASSRLISPEFCFITLR